MVVPRAMVRDIATGKKGIKIMAQLALVGAIVPIAAPTLGGLIVAKFPWRVLFWIMTIYGFLGTVSVIIMLPDTLPIRYRIQSSIRSILWRYIRIVPIVIIMGCLGFIFPNCTIFAFTLHGRKIGSASALLGTIQFILGALSSWIMGLLPQDNMLYVAIGVFIGVLGFFLCNLWRQYATCKIISKMQERVSKGNNNFDRLIKDLK